jgi:hypothetical protein
MVLVEPAQISLRIEEEVEDENASLNSRPAPKLMMADIDALSLRLRSQVVRAFFHLPLPEWDDDYLASFPIELTDKVIDILSTTSGSVLAVQPTAPDEQSDDDILVDERLPRLPIRAQTIEGVIKVGSRGKPAFRIDTEDNVLSD